MNKTMKYEPIAVIESKEMLGRIIDALGDQLQEIERLTAEAKSRKNLIREYAENHNCRAHATERYRFKLVKGEAPLKVRKDLKRADVIGLMQADPLGEPFIVTDYDSAAIKDALKAKALGAEQLAAFGLELAAPPQSVKVMAK